MIGVVQALLVHRAAINLLLSAFAAVVGPYALPLPAAHPLFRFIAFMRPGLYAAISYGYVTLWASTTFVALTVLTSVLCIVFARFEAAQTRHALPPYPIVSQRKDLFLVLGEQYERHGPKRA